MSTEDIISHALTGADLAKIKLLGTPRIYRQGQVIFVDGDNANHIYFIETGSVSIFIEKFGLQEEISTLGPGDYFGEMAFFNSGKRSASATAQIDTMLLCVDRAAFLNLFESDQDIADKINSIFMQRNEELSFKEHLTGGHSSPGNKSFQIDIKGDPSLRYSAFTRERYDSVVDRIIFDLQPRLYDLLVNRSAYEIFIHCNSGEVHIRSVFDPFNGEIHPASKLLNIAYIERHFPVIAYEEKSELIKHLYGFIRDSAGFTVLPDRYKDTQQACPVDWEPVDKREIANTISRLFQLRNIPNFYLRNFSIGIVRDSIRMQFNCDGTQIVNAQGFQRFLQQGVKKAGAGPAPSDERRSVQRRGQIEKMARARFHFGERRGPSGRRQEDWETITGHLPGQEAGGA